MKILRAAVGAVDGKRLNDDVVDVGAKENVPVAVGFGAAKPNDEPAAAVLVAGNNEVPPPPPPPEKINQFEIYKNCCFYSS
jgi:hypothetical protein